MNTRLIAVPLFLLVAACDRAENDIKEAVRSSLVDPQSAMFGEVRLSSNGNSACVTVNAKNSLGGYVGNRQVVAHRDPQTGVWSSAGALDDYADQAFCMEVISGIQEGLTNETLNPTPTENGM